MDTSRPPVLLATLIASLILTLTLFFLTSMSQSASVHAAIYPTSTPSNPSTGGSGSAAGDLQTASSAQQSGVSSSSQALIPAQPAAENLTPPVTQSSANGSVDLNTFAQQVRDGQANELRGVYVEGLFALKVVTQPAGDVGYVSTDPGTTTLFQLTDPSVTGLLAHNVLDGAKFLDLKPGQIIRLIYGDGSIRSYQVEGMREFQRLDRSNLQSDFIETQTNTQMTSQQVFDWFYTGSPHLTLQTCVAKDGLLDWGVRFIVAFPIT